MSWDLTEHPRSGNLRYETSKVEMSLRCLRNSKALWLEVVKEGEGSEQGRGVGRPMGPVPSGEL